MYSLWCISILVATRNYSVIFVNFHKLRDPVLGSARAIYPQISDPSLFRHKLTYSSFHIVVNEYPSKPGVSCLNPVGKK